MDALRKTLLAEGGRDGFDSYRVPGLAVTAAGTLLACCEGRIKEGDRRTLLLYRSTDDGATFAPRTVLAEPAPGQLLHNPMLLACRDGRVLLFWCSDYGHLYLRVSRDDGCTFGEARNLTGTIDGFRKEWPVTLWAIAPGHGVEMKNGTLVVPLWLSRGENAHAKHAVPKNQSPEDYSRATGLEALMGYLYLSGQMERIGELFDIAGAIH